MFAALLLLAPAAVPGAELLEGCKKSPAPGGAQYACENLLASVTELPGLPVKDALATQIEGIRAAVRGEVSTTESPFSSGGKTWPGVRISVKQPGEEQPFFDGRLLAFESKPGVVRLVMCGTPAGAPEAAKCEKLLVTFATEGPAPFAGPPVEPKFLGKKLKIEKGCQTLDASDKGFSIACGQNTLLSAMELDSANDMDGVLRMLGNELVHRMAGAKEGPQRPCKVGGVATKCRTIDAKDAQSDMLLVLGAVKVGATPVFAQCGQAKTQKGVHPMCKQVMSF